MFGFHHPVSQWFTVTIYIVSVLYSIYWLFKMLVRKLMGLFLNLSFLVCTSQNLVAINLVTVIFVLGLNHLENLVCFKDFLANLLNSLFLLANNVSIFSCFRADL